MTIIIYLFIYNNDNIIPILYCKITLYDLTVIIFIYEFKTHGYCYWYCYKYIFKMLNPVQTEQ